MKWRSLRSKTAVLLRTSFCGSIKGACPIPRSLQPLLELPAAEILQIPVNVSCVGWTDLPTLYNVTHPTYVGAPQISAITLSFVEAWIL